ncbi:hypothetical protein [Bradyrhizobium sp. WSM1743]
MREARAVLVLDNVSPVVMSLSHALDRYTLLRAHSGADLQRWTRNVADF